MDQEKIGKFIRDLRVQNNLTQRDFAESLGVTYQAVSKWETGRNIPDIAILRLISEKFNVNITDILDGEFKSVQTNQKKFNKKIIIIPVLLVILIVGFIIWNNNRTNIEVNPVTSTCDDFKITGIALYNQKKSSFYISNIEYCGKKDDKVYHKISCSLYEDYDDTIKKISECEVGNDTTLEDYLKNVSIKVDNYSTICKDFKKMNLYLEINASDDSTMDYNHKIPLDVKSDCE